MKTHKVNDGYLISGSAAEIALLTALQEAGKTGLSLEDVAGTLGQGYERAWTKTKELEKAGIVRREPGKPDGPGQPALRVFWTDRSLKAIPDSGPFFVVVTK